MFSGGIQRDQWHEMSLKNRFVGEKEEAYRNKWNVIFYFGAMFFEVKAWTFEQLIIFQAPSSIFVS